MTRVAVLRLAVSGLAAAGLVVAPSLAGITTATASTDHPDAIESIAADPARVGVWVPGERQRALRLAQLGGLRYTAAALDHAEEVRADAVAIGTAAIDAAAAVVDLHAAAVDTWTAVALEDTSVRLEGLLRRSGWAAGVAPADETEAAADLATARRITAAAAELFRLSHQVEVAAGTVDVEDELHVPTGLRAPEAIDPVDDAADAGPGGQGSAAQGQVEGQRDGQGDGHVEGQGDGRDTAPGAEGSPPSGEDGQPAEGQQGQPADQPGEQPGERPEGAPVPPVGDVTGGQGDATVPDPAVSPDQAQPLDGSQVPPVDEAGNPPAVGTEGAGTEGAGTEEPDGAADVPEADLAALPEEYAAGISDLEQRVAALSAVLARGTERTVGLLVLEPEDTPVDGPSLLERVAFQAPEAGPWENGRIPTEELCPVSFALEARLRCDAAASLELLNLEYRAHFGEDLGIVSSYRSIDQQISVRASRGWLAAPPGTSKHGLGVAVDLAGFGGLGQFDNPRHVWMRQHGPTFGWEHPRIMRPGGGGPPEPWHFEFVGSGIGATSTGTGDEALQTRN